MALSAFVGNLDRDDDDYKEPIPFWPCYPQAFFWHVSAVRRAATSRLMFAAMHESAYGTSRRFAALQN
jgi:hypothetical protein